MTYFEVNFKRFHDASSNIKISSLASNIKEVYKVFLGNPHRANATQP